MSPLPQSTIKRLADFESTTFESALVEFDAALSSNPDGPLDLLLSACRGLADAETLGSVERQRRVGLVLSRVSMTDSLSRDLARAAASFPAEVQNAIAAAVPAKFRGLTYGRSAPQEGTPVLNVAQETPDTTIPEPEEEGCEHGVVLLLGNASEHERNVRHLRTCGFATQRVNKLDEFHHMLSDDVCGIVVSKSWWAAVPSDSHGEFLDELVRFSSFVWLKINTDGLAVQDVIGRSRQARFRDPKANELNISTSHHVTEQDLLALQESANAMQQANQVRLYPGEIPSADARLIAGCAKSYIHNRSIAVHDLASDIPVTILHGGKSGAMLAQVSPNRRSLPFTVKIGEVALLREEMNRFDQFIAPIDQQLNPQLYFHGERGAIVFGLVDTPDDSRKSAPTLYDTLQESLLSEAGGLRECATESDFKILITRLVSQLKQLNAECADNSRARSLIWTSVESLTAMDSSGITWGMSPLSNGSTPLECRHDAVEYLHKLDACCIIHGDVHLRNILVRDQREPHLIDYAYAGPGHPCYDLVRLECFLFFQAFRMTDREEVVRDLLMTLGRGSVSLRELESTYPNLCNGVGNRTAIRASIEVRQACMELLEKHGGDERQYHAMKMVISCQRLPLPDCQTGIVRASVSAAAELFSLCGQTVASDSM